jgi:nucleobase:cation symporter-1, NCS1 family
LWIDLSVSDIIGVVAAIIQSIFFGLILLMFILHETSNAFADLYPAAVSTQSIFHKIKQRYLIIGYCSYDDVPISQYETILLLIGAVFVPLFGVVISDYYIVVMRRH